jgi:putative membrane-bound dehydrogenase-like protein
MTRSFTQPFRTARFLPSALLFACLSCTTATLAQEAQWIWSPEHDKDDVPEVVCHFRKTFVVRDPDRGQITILADDRFELFMNGRRIGRGEGTDQLLEYDVSDFLSRGRNVVGIRVVNERGSTAGVAARVMIREVDEDWVSYSTDATWRANLRALPLWNTSLYNDNRWPDAQELGQLGETPPWDVREAVPEDEGDLSTERFKHKREFVVDELLDHEQTGSLIAFTFNEFGQILAGRGGGPLLLIYDSDDNGTPDRVRTYCDQVKNCQGILALNGDVFVTAEGPEGSGLYRLSDKDRDGKLEAVQKLVSFAGNSGEHGAHSVTLGPDGKLYVVVGNHATVEAEFSESSPYRSFYEGDLVQPRYEDPSGHANGVPAPGGVIVRTDLEGTQVELVAGGLRNVYDMAFNRQGDLFVHDSDMESDVGTTWYRPTRIYHVIPGGEFGWRSGWAKWPEYFVDNLPELLDTGRGSPTGAVFYEHFAFPSRYHNLLFLADWSEGRILAVDVKRDGASYSAKSEVFLEGQPMNVTDLEVGPDGALYFITGGRGTNGGIYRVKWRGDIPESVSDLGEGITAVIRHPQLHSAWGRQRIAGLKKQMGDEWSPNILGVARSKSNPWFYRVRALELMLLFGPPPSNDLLMRLSSDESEVVRAKAAETMGLQPDETTGRRLLELLRDNDRTVRRKACEALAAAGHPVSFDEIDHLLVSDDHTEAWAARRLLERIPTEEWREKVLTSDDHRLFIQGAIALLAVLPDRSTAIEVLSRFSDLIGGFVSDRNFVDMLRVAQVALHRGQIQPDDVPEIATKLGEEFPSGDATMNRELIRLLAYLQVSKPMDRYLEYLESQVDGIDKVHVAMHLSAIKDGWKPGQRLALLEFLQKAGQQEGGQSYKLYIENIQRDVAKGMSREDSRAVLARATEWPGAALGALYGLPAELDAKTIEQLQRIDEQIRKDNSETADSLRIGIVAVLVRSGSEEGMAYLRSMWDKDPEHRQNIAMGLAQFPDGENWDYLVESLPIVEGNAAVEVLMKLQTVGYSPENPEFYRQVILRGLELKDPGAAEASALLRFWTAAEVADEDATWEESMQAWQEWFAEQYPDYPAAELPVSVKTSKWQFEELLEHLTNEPGSHGSLSQGAEVFKKAQCSKCHRFGGKGEAMGPDLTSISKRFMKKEVLQSILFPSHNISDQYRSKTLVTTGGKTYVGIVGAGAAGEKVVLQANGKKIAVKEGDIDEIVTNNKSAMPANLLDELTLAEISDLFTYLGMLPAQNVARGRAEDTRN